MENELILAVANEYIDAVAAYERRRLEYVNAEEADPDMESSMFKQYMLDARVLSKNIEEAQNHLLAQLLVCARKRS